MVWRSPAAERRFPVAVPQALPRPRARRVLLAHVDGEGLGAFPLGGVVRHHGGAYRVSRHQGVPPAAGQLDWTYAVWGAELR